MLSSKSTMSIQEESLSEDNTEKIQTGNTDDLLIYKTKYDPKFHQVKISSIIRKEIEKTASRTKDSDLKEFLETVKPLVCYKKNDNLSNILVRANVKHYTS